MEPNARTHCPGEARAAATITHFTKWAAEMAAAAKLVGPKMPTLKTTGVPKAKIGPQTSDYVPSFINNSGASAQRASGDRLDANAAQSMPT